MLISGLVFFNDSYAQEESVEKKKFEKSMIKNKLNKKVYEEKRIIIVYKDSITSKDLDDLTKKTAKIQKKFKLIPAVAVTVKENWLNKIQTQENVLEIFEDVRVHSTLGDSIPQINASQVHSSGITGSGVNVCIVDTGVDDSHSALNQLVAQYDFVNNDADAFDDKGHGTHVAGIVASNDLTFGGVAPGSSLMAAKVLDSTGSGWSSDVILGIEWCVQNGANIISMSLASGLYTGICDSTPIAIASNMAVDQGVVVIAATGNDGLGDALAAPSCASKVISVGAVDKNDSRTNYSNEGAELDIVAPGSSIVSTYPGNSFSFGTGTSMATPHVAGIASLLLEKNGELTPSEIRTILRDSALDLGDSGFDTIYGYGRVDAFSAYSLVEEPVTSDSYPLTVTTVDSTGSEMIGFYTVLSQASNTVEVGFSPAIFTLNTQQVYSVQVQNFADYVFDYWEDTGSTANTRNVVIESDTQFSAVYRNISTPSPMSSGNSQLVVRTIDSSGEMLGYFTVLSQGGAAIDTGFSPSSFSLNDGQNYDIRVGNFGDLVFDHWQDSGSTLNERNISITSYTEITAVYRNLTDPLPSEKSELTVKTANSAGTEIFGYYTIIFQNGVQVDQGFSPLSFIVNNGETYQVAAYGYNEVTFDRWDNGSIEPLRNFSVESDAIFTAFYLP